MTEITTDVYIIGFWTTLLCVLLLYMLCKSSSEPESESENEDMTENKIKELEEQLKEAQNRALKWEERTEKYIEKELLLLDILCANTMNDAQKVYKCIAAIDPTRMPNDNSCNNDIKLVRAIEKIIEHTEWRTVKKMASVRMLLNPTLKTVI